MSYAIRACCAAVLAGLAGVALAADGRDTYPVQGAFSGGPPDWGRHARVVLYEGPNLSGRAFVVNSDYMRNLDGTGFNDRAESLRVEDGYWMFCSDANFQGTCRTFGPGQYAQLPPGLADRISSGRRIAEHYPYRDRPNWDNRTGYYAPRG
jgi:hypothetical protein